MDFCKEDYFSCKKEMSNAHLEIRKRLNSINNINSIIKIIKIY